MNEDNHIKNESGDIDNIPNSNKNVVLGKTEYEKRFENNSREIKYTKMVKYK